MKLDMLTKHAIQHTLHCLLGCGIGEITGMVISTHLGWHGVLQTTLATVLAFCFGYWLAFYSYIRSGNTIKSAVKGTLAAETLSITSMEVADNAFIWIVPGAINAVLTDGLFWWSLIASLAVGFIITVPVNRFLMSRGIGHSH